MGVIYGPIRVLLEQKKDKLSWGAKGSQFRI